MDTRSGNSKISDKMLIYNVKLREWAELFLRLIIRLHYSWIEEKQRKQWIETHACGITQPQHCLGISECVPSAAATEPWWHQAWCTCFQWDPRPKGAPGWWLDPPLSAGPPGWNLASNQNTYLHYHCSYDGHIHTMLMVSAQFTDGVKSVMYWRQNTFKSFHNFKIFILKLYWYQNVQEYINICLHCNNQKHIETTD